MGASSAKQQTREVVVIGAGPAGLAVAAELNSRRVEVVVLERADTVAATWHGHYDRLRLHTVRWLSGLPGMAIPRRYGPWVARDDVITYLEDYAAHHALDIELGVSVQRLDRNAAAWTMRTSDGEMTAGAVVVATGYNHTPRMPAWPGASSFTGDVLHASRYRNGQPYAGRDVLVVGAGNTGAEIAVDLVETGAARVRIAVRTSPHVVRRSISGVPTTLTSVLTRRLPGVVMDPVASGLSRLSVGDLSPYGITKPVVGAYTRVRRDGQIPILDVGFIDALKAGDVRVVAAVEGFDGPAVLLADGSRIHPDVVVAATGYDRGLDSLVGHLGILGPDRRPTVHGARTHPRAPALYFSGFSNPISGNLREVRLDARRIARVLASRAYRPARRPPGDQR